MLRRVLTCLALFACCTMLQAADIVVVVRTKAANAGDFVIAIVDDEFTLKELALEKGKFVLKPHNPAYPVIDGDEAVILGKVVSVMRGIG